MELKIKKFLENLSAEKAELALKVREIVLKANTSVKEDIKWGMLAFIANGYLGFIYTYKTVPYINLGFRRATELIDPKSLLEGTGKSMRHITIYSKKDIDAKQITLWVKEAVRLNANAIFVEKYLIEARRDEIKTNYKVSSKEKTLKFSSNTNDLKARLL